MSSNVLLHGLLQRNILTNSSQTSQGWIRRSCDASSYFIIIQYTIFSPLRTFIYCVALSTGSYSHKYCNWHFAARLCTNVYQKYTEPAWHIRIKSAFGKFEKGFPVHLHLSTIITWVPIQIWFFHSLILCTRSLLTNFSSVTFNSTCTFHPQPTQFWHGTRNRDDWRGIITYNSTHEGWAREDRINLRLRSSTRRHARSKLTLTF